MLEQPTRWATVSTVVDVVSKRSATCMWTTRHQRLRVIPVSARNARSILRADTCTEAANSGTPRSSPGQALPGANLPTRTERRPPPTKLPQQPPPETTEGPGHRRSTQDHQQPGPQQPQVKCRRRPTLPHPPRCSTIGAGRLSFRVRKGTGRDPAAKTTDKHYRTNHTHPTTEDPPKKAMAQQTVGVPCRSRHCTMNANT